MTTEHHHMEATARELDEKSADLLDELEKGLAEFPDTAEQQAAAYRRCATIIRHQIECEA